MLTLCINAECGVEYGHTVAEAGQLGRPDKAGPALDEMHTLWSRPVGDIGQELVERHGYTSEYANHLMGGLAKAGLEGVAVRE